MLDREGIVSTKVRELSHTSLIDSETYFFSKNLIFLKIKVITYFYLFFRGKTK